jgi:deoxycytidylate deaminase
MLINAEIHKVVYSEAYPDDLAKEMAIEARYCYDFVLEKYDGPRSETV